jgi:glutathionyl-hydroquinone reductase
MLNTKCPRCKGIVYMSHIHDEYLCRSCADKEPVPLRKRIADNFNWRQDNINNGNYNRA